MLPSAVILSAFVASKITSNFNISEFHSSMYFCTHDNVPSSLPPLPHPHHQGCLGRLEAFIRSESLVFIVMGCGLAGIVLCGMIISLCLCRAIGSDGEENETSGQERRE